MCVVSMVSDHYTGKWNNDYFGRTYPTIIPNNPFGPIKKEVNIDSQILANALIQAKQQQEIDALRKEVEEMKALLIRAKKYDDDNNEPNCELAEKVTKLKKIADIVGVNLEDVFNK